MKNLIIISAFIVFINASFANVENRISMLEETTFLTQEQKDYLTYLLILRNNYQEILKDLSYETQYGYIQYYSDDALTWKQETMNVDSTYLENPLETYVVEKRSSGKKLIYTEQYGGSARILQDTGTEKVELLNVSKRWDLFSTLLNGGREQLILNNGNIIEQAGASMNEENTNILELKDMQLLHFLDLEQVKIERIVDEIINQKAIAKQISMDDNQVLTIECEYPATGPATGGYYHSSFSLEHGGMPVKYYHRSGCSDCTEKNKDPDSRDNIWSIEVNNIEYSVISINENESISYPSTFQLIKYKNNNIYDLIHFYMLEANTMSEDFQLELPKDIQFNTLNPDIANNPDQYSDLIKFYESDNKQASLMGNEGVETIRNYLLTSKPNELIAKMKINDNKSNINLQNIAFIGLFMIGSVFITLGARNKK